VSEITFSNRILRRFVEAAAVELGADQFHAMLALSKLPPEWTKPQIFLKMEAAESAKAYASLQAAIRTYYGRGARGVLLRVGQRLWNFLLEDAALVDKTHAAFIRRLPLNTRRRKATLEFLARLIAKEAGDITIHTLDLDLLFVDHASPTAEGQRDSHPICFVTLGLIRESLLWATEQRFDVEEISCKAIGEDTCEFRITVGK